MSEKQTCVNCPGHPTRVVFITRQGRRVVQCRRCRLQFAEKYPDYEEAESAIYGQDYFRGSIDKLKQRKNVFSELLAEIELVLRRKGRLLDVGAGEGTLLKVAAKLGWGAEGTEIASAMIRYVRDELGLTVHKGILEEIELPESSFDAIVLNHVLEHVKNPRTTLEKVARLLSSSGVVRIEVPNLASLSSRAKNLQSLLNLKKDPWKHYSTGHHFWFFTPRTLKKTVETSGLSTVFMNAPAKQWGTKNPLHRFANAVCKRTLLGGHLIVYARVQNHVSTPNA
ncbi:MAG: methyltransferase domain-containing protein [Candidatus Latescibacteria bacterium]|nr:methyltransferase domain-containing protein [Candidatus Latescibacterota bacterium]NIO28451.1 methyltransferase domain-containing protein [Candidatus Latescibacterota bacterium]NIO56000.1 methyltransferase domain-containing protein [Candidatus Latescibacterota bacterium]NIT01964.1 methyltransferase domain-containing protein [Candidatus Latescibacterota bacterium]